MSLIQHKRINLYHTDAPSALDLEIVKAPIGRNRPSISDIKTAIKDTDRYVENEIMIDRPNSPYDCTGKQFTSGIDRIKREIVKGFDGISPYEEYFLMSIYEHHISIDV